MGLLGTSYYRFCGTAIGCRAAQRFVSGMRRLGVLQRFHLPIDALDLGPEAVAGLMRLWSRIHWSVEDGMMPADQLLAIYRLAVEWPCHGDVVELGAWTGLTTSYLGTACAVRHSGQVYAVDTFEGTREGGDRYEAIERYGGNTLTRFERRVRQAGLGHRIEPMVGDTARMSREYRGRDVRLLFIDADHSFEGVARDFEAWHSLVAPGGLVIFHDYDMPEAGVARFVHQVVAEHPDFELQPGLVVKNVMAVKKKSDCHRSAPARTVIAGGRRRPDGTR